MNRKNTSNLVNPRSKKYFREFSCSLCDSTKPRRGAYFRSFRVFSMFSQSKSFKIFPWISVGSVWEKFLREPCAALSSSHRKHGKHRKNALHGATLKWKNEKMKVLWVRYHWVYGWDTSTCMGETPRPVWVRHLNSGGRAKREQLYYLVPNSNGPPCVIWNKFGWKCITQLWLRRAKGSEVVK